MAGVTRNWANVRRSAAHFCNIVESATGRHFEFAPALEDFDCQQFELGTTIALSTTIGSFEMGLFCNTEAAQIVSEVLFGGLSFESNDRERLDALGEIANMVMGRIKQDVVESTGELLPLAVPRSHDLKNGESYKTRSVPICGLRIQDSQGPHEFCLTWSERNASVLLAEVRALVVDDVLPDEHCLMEVVDLLAEVVEAIPEHRKGQQDRVLACQRLVLNGLRQGHDLNVLRRHILSTVLGLSQSARAMLRSAGVINPNPHACRRRGGALPEIEDPSLDGVEPDGLSMVDAFFEGLDEEIEVLCELLDVDGRWPVEAPIVNRAMRRLAAIEGQANMLGVEELRSLVHGTNEVLAAVSDGALSYSEACRRTLRDAFAMMAELGSSRRAALRQGLPGEPAAGLAELRLRLASMLDLDIVDEHGCTGHDEGAIDYSALAQGQERDLRQQHFDRLLRASERVEQLAAELRDSADTPLVEDLSVEFSELGRQIVGLHTELTLVPASHCAVVVARQAREHARTAQRLVQIDVDAEGVDMPADLVTGVAELVLELLLFTVSHSIENSTERMIRGKPHLAEINVAFKNDAGVLSVSVQDDGRGFPGMHLPSLVAAQAQFVGLVDPRVTPNLRELNRIPRMCARMDADIEFETQRGEGCRFELRVPFPTYAGASAYPIEDDAKLASGDLQGLIVF